MCEDQKKRETNRCELLTKYTNIMEDPFYVGVRPTSFTKGGVRYPCCTPAAAPARSASASLCTSNIM
ncbi:unnamed protein product [Prunus brigantina]